MPKIVRFNGNLKAFASAAPGTERTIFGDVAQADDLTSQINADYLRGWGIVGPSDQPTLEDFNAAMYTHGQLLSYLHQVGVPEHDMAQEYYVGSIAQVSGALYYSLINGNIGNAPTSSPAQWRGIAAQATETAAGVARIATQIEMNNGIGADAIATPPKIHAWIASGSAQATETLFGVAKVATQTQVNAGVDDLTIVTPSKLISWFNTTFSQATEAVAGLIRIATQAETNNGTIDTKAITPKKLIDWVASGTSQATEALLGFLRIATTSQATAGTNDTTAMTPLKTAQAIAANNTAQTLQDVVGSRTLGGSYNNTTGKTITVMVTILGTTGAETCVATVGGVTVYNGDPGYGTSAQITFVVPHNASYSLDVNPKSGTNLQTWVELR